MKWQTKYQKKSPIRKIVFVVCKFWVLNESIKIKKEKNEIVHDYFSVNSV